MARDIGRRKAQPGDGGRIADERASGARRTEPVCSGTGALQRVQHLAGNRVATRLVEGGILPAVHSHVPGHPAIQRDWVTDNDQFDDLATFNFNWFRAVEELAHDETAGNQASEQRMLALIRYRDLVVDKLLRETMDDVAARMARQDSAAAGMGEIVRGKIDYVKQNGAGYLIRAFAAGSTNLTSDYDITFAIPRMPNLETDAVVLFNTSFRDIFGREPGMVFDTNVYTSGFMPPETKELLSEVPEGAPLYTKKDKLQIKGGTGKTDKHQLQLAFSVLPIRQFFGAGDEGAGRFWAFAGRALRNLDRGLIDSTVPKELQDQAINDALVIFTVADKLYAETESAIAAKKRELAPEGGPESPDIEFNLDMLARDTLYEDQLVVVSGLLRQIDAMVEGFRATSPTTHQALEYEQLLSHFQIEQGKALVYANEAYFSGGPAVHVVLGMQKGDNIRLGRQQQLQSLLMNIGYKLAHFSHKLHDAGSRDEQRGFGRATYSTAKYGERVADVVGGTGDRKGAQPQPLRSDKSERAGVFAAKDVNLAGKLAKEELDVLAREVDIVKSIKKNEQLTAVAKEGAAARYGPQDVGGQDMMAAFLGIAAKAFAPYYIDKYREKGRLWAKAGTGGTVDTPSVI